MNIQQWCEKCSIDESYTCLCCIKSIIKYLEISTPPNFNNKEETREEEEIKGEKEKTALETKRTKDAERFKTAYQERAVVIPPVGTTGKIKRYIIAKKEDVKLIPEIKKIALKERERILDECIRNPSKYLNEVE